MISKLNIFISLFVLPCLVAGLVQADEPTVLITGEPKLWHKITLTLDGPDAEEAGNPNPFLDYRLDVTFTNECRRFSVPGFYAADGNAAESSASSGNKWQVHFRPDQVGLWEYQVSFRTGPDVALKPAGDDTGSAPWSPLDGAHGVLRVKESSQHAPDLRAPELGRVIYDGTHVLKYAGSGKAYLKAGEGSPENFLAYFDFDQTMDLKNNKFNAGLAKGLHKYQRHCVDWLESNPTWQAGKGKGIIGAVNYLASQDVNNMYFLTFNIGPKERLGSGDPRKSLARACGDGGDVWPWTSPTQRLQFDVSKLAQWDIVFTHMNNCGVGMTLMLAEAENEEALDDSATTPMGPERALYYREMVARFGHHLDITWVIAEETGTYSAPGIVRRNKVRMKRLSRLDPYRHPIGLHNGKVKLRDYAGCQDMTYYSYQSHDETLKDIYPDIVKLRLGSEQTPPSWAIMNDEQGKGFSGVGTNTDNWDPGFAITRRDALWGTFMAGGTGVSWYHGGDYPEGDGNCEDFTARSELFHFTRVAMKFFRENEISLTNLRSRQDLLVDSTRRRCLAEEGKVYILQLKQGKDSAALKLKGERFEVTWFDPIKGSKAKGSVKQVSGGKSVSIGLPPYGEDRDWIVLLRSAATKPKIVDTIDVDTVWAANRVGFALKTIGERQYAAYYDRDRMMTVAMRFLNSNEWQKTTLPSQLMWDSHNRVVLGIDEAGRVHVSGNMHVHPLCYFRSAEPYDIRVMLPYHKMLGDEEARVTYPKFFEDRSGRLLFSYRSGSCGNGNILINRFHAQKQQWMRHLQTPLFAGISADDNRAAYHRFVKDSSGRFHFVWMWRWTPKVETCHQLCYASSTDLIHWTNAAGKPVALPFIPDMPEVIVDDVASLGGLHNSRYQIILTPDGQPLIGYVKYDVEGRTQLYVARPNGSEWIRKQVSDWNFRWQFIGGGDQMSSGGSFRMAGVSDEGVLFVDWSTEQGDSGLYRIDSRTLASVSRSAELQPMYPPNLNAPMTNREGMFVNLCKDGADLHGRKYVLKWESRGPSHGRNAPKEIPDGPLSKLVLLEIANGAD